MEHITNKFMKFYQSSRNPRFNHDKKIKNYLKTRNPMGEKYQLVKSHIPGDEIHREVLRFKGWNC